MLLYTIRADTLAVDDTQSACAALTLWLHVRVLAAAAAWHTCAQVRSSLGEEHAICPLIAGGVHSWGKNSLIHPQARMWTAVRTVPTASMTLSLQSGLGTRFKSLDS